MYLYKKLFYALTISFYNIFTSLPNKIINTVFLNNICIIGMEENRGNKEACKRYYLITPA